MTQHVGTLSQTSSAQRATDDATAILYITAVSSYNVDQLF